MRSSPDLIAFKVPAACLVQIYLEMMMGGLQDQVWITHLLSICPSKPYEISIYKQPTQCNKT